MRTSDEINEVAGALAEAQGALRPASKDSENPAYKSKYADMAAVWEACREALPRFGLAVIQDVTNFETEIAVTTRITHKSGQWLECGPLLVPMARADAHGLGSAISYGKRYALSAAIGIVAEEDDDGNAATGDGTAPARRSRDNATADAAKQRMGISTGPAFNPATAQDPGGLIGTAEIGKADADFQAHMTPTGHRLAFSLVEGSRKIKVEALDALALQIAEYREGIEGFRVTCWGKLRDETFTPANTTKAITYQILTLSKLKVGPLELSGAPAETPAEAESGELFPVPA